MFLTSSIEKGTVSKGDTVLCELNSNAQCTLEQHTRYSHRRKYWTLKGVIPALAIKTLSTGLKWIKEVNLKKRNLIMTKSHNYCMTYYPYDILFFLVYDYTCTFYVYYVCIFVFCVYCSLIVNGLTQFVSPFG